MEWRGGHGTVLVSHFRVQECESRSALSQLHHFGLSDILLKWVLLVFSARWYFLSTLTPLSVQNRTKRSTATGLSLRANTEDLRKMECYSLTPLPTTPCHREILDRSTMAHSDKEGGLESRLAAERFSLTIQIFRTKSQ
jgi:hypothetical protein